MIPLGLLLAGGAVAADADLDWHRPAAVWRSPTRPEREAVLDAVFDLASTAETCPDHVFSAAGARLADVGLRLDALDLDGTRVLVVTDGATPFGAGQVAIRCGPATPLVWQAPHPYFDVGTGHLVRDWFRETDARAAMWATHHRFEAREGEIRHDEVHPADVAREPGSLFHAMTVALSWADPALRFVQVHGYAASSAPEWRAIASSGDRRNPPADAGARIAAVVGPTGLYGVTTTRLGGSRNQQGRHLSQWSGRFLHLELDPRTRAALREDAEARKALADALEGAW